MADRTILGSAVTPLRFTFFMWLAFALEFRWGWSIEQWALTPRTLRGLPGILLSPFIHANVYHLISNSIPVLFLGTVLFYFYRPIASKVFFRCFLWTNILVWLFARPALHLGASGVVYGLAFFLIFFGFFKRDFMSLLVSVVTILLYGSVFYGVFPSDPAISWESHFAGALVGITSAVTFGFLQRTT